MKRKEEEEEDMIGKMPSSAAVAERREGGTGPLGVIACFFVFLSE